MMKIKKQYSFLQEWGDVIIFSTILLSIFILIPPTFAQMINLPKVEGVSSVPDSGNYTFYFFIQNSLIPVVKFILEGVAIAYIVYYGADLIFSLGKDETIKNSRRALWYALIGFLLLNVGDEFVQVFNPDDNFGEPDSQRWGLLIRALIDGLRYVAGIIAVTWLIISGYRLVTAGGKEDTINKHKTQIVFSALGLVFIAVSGVFVDVIYNAKTDVSFLMTFINLMLLLTVPLGVIFLIVGGVYMIISRGNDAELSKGKKIFQGTIIALIIIYSSYALLSEVLKFSNW